MNGVFLRERLITTYKGWMKSVYEKCSGLGSKMEKALMILDHISAKSI